MRAPLDGTADEGRLPPATRTENEAWLPPTGIDRVLCRGVPARHCPVPGGDWEYPKKGVDETGC